MNAIRIIKTKLRIFFTGRPAAMLLAGFLPLTILAANPFAGNYGGGLYARADGSPETYLTSAALQVDAQGNITGTLFGTVDGAGNILWSTPSMFGMTNGLIANGVMAATGTSGTTTFRLAATFTGGNFAGSGNLLWRVPSTGSGYSPGNGFWTWNSVAYGNGRFVAVGFSGLRAVSLDGTNWNAVPVVTTRPDWSDVAFGNGMFLAVSASGGVLTSADGYQWSTNAANAFLSVAFGNDQFLAVDSAGGAYSSPDGTTWTPVAGAAAGQNFTAVDYANGLFVLMGSTGRFQTSADGVSWNPVRTNGATALTGAAYGAGRWAIGGTTRFVTFANATGSDQAATNTIGFSINSVAARSNLLVAATSYSYPPAYSTNGLTWTFASGLADTIRSIAHGTNGVFVAVGNFIQSSADGRVWTIRTTTMPMVPANNVAETAYGIYQDQATFTDALNRRREVRVGLGGRIETRFLDSTNGALDFVPAASPTTNALRRILSALPPLIVGDKGTILRYDSANDSWAPIPSPTSADLCDAASSGQSSYVAVGSGGMIIRASDYYGTNWAVVSSGTGQNLHSVFNNLTGTFIACGDSGTLLYSSDYGATWSSRNTGVTNRLMRAWGADYNGCFYAFPETGQFFLVTTNSGNHWASVALGQPFRVNSAGKMDQGFSLTLQSGLYGGSVAGYAGAGGYYRAPSLPTFRSAAYGNGRYVLLAETNTAVSTNGLAWTAGRTEIAYRYGAQKARAITYGQGIFVALGAYGLVETSPDGVNWTLRNASLTNTDFNAICYGDGRFVAVGAGGAIWSSTNGVNWIDSSFSNPGGTLSGVAYGNGRFVAYGLAQGGTSLIRSSTNGVTWQASSAPSSMTALAGFANGLFIGTGNSQLFTSANGTSWTASSPPALSFYGNQVAWGGGRYVLGCGTYNSSQNGATVLNSTDGANWYAEIVPGTGYYPDNTPLGVLAANGKFILYSHRGEILTEDYVETNSLPLMTAHPAPAAQTASSGATVVYSAAASGSGVLTYRWLKDGLPLFDGPGISGAASPTLTLSGVDAAAAGSYQLSAANAWGSDLSQAASLAVAGPPVFLRQPQSATVPNAALASLSALATSAMPAAYQWYLNGAPLTNGGSVLGANGNTIYLRPATGPYEGDYYLVASNTYGTATSALARLTVLRAPTILQLPVTVAPAPAPSFRSPLLVFPGQDLAISAVVDGTGPLSYQWKAGTNAIAGATNLTLALANIQSHGLYTYSLQVTNAYGSALLSTQWTVVGPGTLRPDMVTFTNLRPVVDVAPLPDGTFLAAGWFELSTGARLSRFSLANLTNVYQTNLVPLADYSPGFNSIAVLSDGSYVVGGSFRANGGSGASFTNLVRLLPDGTLDTAFRPANANTITKLLPLAAGKFLALRIADAYAASPAITRYLADGTVDSAFSQIANSSANYQGLALQTNGTLWYAGTAIGLWQAGSDGTGASLVDNSFTVGRVFVPADQRVYYTSAGAGTSITRRRNADGSTNTFNLTLNNSLYAVAALPNGKLVIGGNFTSVGATPANYIAMLNEDGTVATNFTSPFSVVGGAAVNDIELLPDGSALLATTALNGVRRLQLYLPDLAIQSDPAALAVNRGSSATFSVVASGSSAVSHQWRFNGTPIPGANLASLTISNAQDAAAGNYDVVITNLSGAATSAVATLTVLGNVRLTQQPVGQSLPYGGTASFSAQAIGAEPLAYQWRKNGTALAGATSRVLTLTGVGPGDIAFYDLVVSNLFGAVTSSPAALVMFATTNGMGAAAGTLMTNFAAAIAPSNSAFITAIALDASNKVLITGSFTNFGGLPRTNFVRLNADLSVDAPTVALNTAPVPAAGLPGGGFALGGYFSTANGSPRAGLAFYDAAGNLQPQPVLNSGAYVDGGYGKNAFAVQPDGKVLVAGYFTSVNGSPRTNLARLNADGSLDADFLPAAINQQVTTVAVQSDGKILIGGYFTTVGGAAQARVARLNTNGTYDATFTNTFSFSQPYGIKALANGKILIFGQGLTAVGGVTRSGIAQLHADGSLDLSFSNKLGGTAAVLDTWLENDGRIIVAGSFTAVNGTNRGCLARLNADGSLDSLYAPGAGANSGAQINSVAKLADGSYLIGGSFTSYDGVARRGLARLNQPPNPPPPLAIVQPPQSQTVAMNGTAAFTVAATGTAPITFQWRKDGTNLLNATNVSLVIAQAQAADAGSYAVLVSDLTGFTTSPAATLTVGQAPGFGTWAANFNLSAGQSGLADDPDRDGLSNLAEYAFGTDPTQASPGRAPRFIWQAVGGTNYPAVQFTRNRQATDVTVAVIASPTVDFSIPAMTATTAADQGQGLDLVTVRGQQAAGTNPALFFRVKVSQP